jgi:short-subunit dehydrogenase
MDFHGKNIWITGASSGIGRAVAIEISKEKAQLILSARSEDSLNEVAEICRKSGSQVTIVPFDLGNQSSVENAAKLVLEKFRSIDALYQFGGISQRSLVSETSLSVDRKIFEVNYFGAVALVKAILPSMISSGGGQIAVTSSLVGKFGFPLRSSYAASKHALHGFFESLLIENKANNIKVSVIIPGRIKTNISLNALTKDGEAHKQMDPGQDKGQLPEIAAKTICIGLRKEKREILVGKSELLMIYIRRFFPSLFFFLASRIKAK